MVDVPVGFKWFAGGLLDGSLGFAGEESAGASFCRRDGSAWTTDKDGITAALLSAEITAVAGHDPGQLYGDLAAQLGSPVSRLVQAAATPAQKQVLAALSPQQLPSTELAGEPVEFVLSPAPPAMARASAASRSARRAAGLRPSSGTEDIYKIYAESFPAPSTCRPCCRTPRPLSMP